MTAHDQIAQLAARLRDVLAEERHAIAALDHARLDALVAAKQLLASELAAARDGADASPQLRTLLEELRIEVHANAMLASIASSAVRGVLGYESTSSTYDRRARAIERRSSAVLARF